MTKKITLYSLTTCSFCKTIQRMLDEFNIQYTCLDVDLLSEVERQQTMDELKSVNPRCSFPTLVIDQKVIIGFMEQEIKDCLELRTEVDDLHDRLQKHQGQKGYYLNSYKEKTYDLLKALLTNKERYGYLACPCRLASGDRQKDRDIICPCQYREEDVNEYGCCYCELYVSNEWNAGTITRRLVPERRPLSE